MLEALRRRASRFGLDVVLVNLWEGGAAASEAARYCEIWGIDGTVLVDEQADYARQLGVRGVPTNLFVDEHGVVRHVSAAATEELLYHTQMLIPGLELDDHEHELVSRFTRHLDASP